MRVEPQRTSARLSWYRDRFQSMSGREILWRASRVGGRLVPNRVRYAGVASVGHITWEAALERFRVGQARPVMLDRKRALHIAQSHPHLATQLIEAADSILESSFKFFGYPAVTLGPAINWNYDPIARHEWPGRPSHLIDHRVAGYDVKWIWELNRLQHLPWLAQAWLFTGDDRYSNAAFAHLDSWMDQNPPDRGIAWRGCFEAGIRAISVAIALQGLRDSNALTVDRYRRTVEMLAQSASRCWQHRSLHSSANNHLIGEMAGLAVISMLFPELRRAARWQRGAVRRLSIESSRQILADGVGAEQAVAYQVFTVELLHLVAMLLDEYESGAPESLTLAIHRSTAFLAAVGDGHNPPLRYGDDDGGFALRLGPQIIRTIPDHLGIVGKSTAGSDRDSLDAVWYRELARGKPNSGPVEQTQTGKSFYARAGGLVVLRTDRRRTTIDVGPLGYLSIAAHGHADALAITLTDDGHELISDPGTGSYYGHPTWRTVLRGTRAHGTVCVDGFDQSVARGPFLWSRHARVRVLDVDLPNGTVVAEHDGYSRLPGKVIHRRFLIAHPDDRAQLVIDLLSGNGNHHVRTNWPLHPCLEVTPVTDGHVAFRDGIPVLHLLYAATSPFAVEETRGDISTNLGWWSEQLETRVPAWWLSTSCVAELPVVVASLMTLRDECRPEKLTVKYEGDRIECFWLENGRSRSVSVRNGSRISVERRRLSPSTDSRGGPS